MRLEKAIRFYSFYVELTCIADDKTKKDAKQIVKWLKELKEFREINNVAKKAYEKTYGEKVKNET